MCCGRLLPVTSGQYYLPVTSSMPYPDSPRPTRHPPHCSASCAYAVYDSGKAIYFILWAPESAPPVSDRWGSSPLTLACLTVLPILVGSRLK